MVMKMTVTNTKILKLKANKGFFFVFVPAATVVFIIAFLMLSYPHIAAEGVKKGLSLCLDTVIPSLFPFMFIVTLIYDMGIFTFFSASASEMMYALFRLPGVALPIMLMSLLGGYPVGATLIEKAYDEGGLTLSQAERMLSFCINPGPAFTVSVIGAGVIGSVKAGVIIYISVTVSALIIAFLSRFFDNEDMYVFEKQAKNNVICDASVLSKAINKSTRSMVSICACILVFSCLNGLTEKLLNNKDILMYFGMLSEVTNGVIIASYNFSLPVIAAVVSFGGFCVHFQVLPVILKLKLRYRLFLVIRVLSAALSCTVAFALIRIFPQYSSVVSLGTKPQSATLEVSFPVCVWLMVMCGLFLIGDNYILSKKLKDKSV